MPTPTPLEARLTAIDTTLTSFAESIDGLAQLALDDRGWKQLNELATDTDLTPKARKDNASQAELHTIANPLIRRGFVLRKGWVWGDGCDIAVTGPDDANTDDTTAWVTEFMERHDGILFGASAGEQLERAMFTRGAVVTMLATDQESGRVTARLIDATSITDVYTNPDDIAEVWYYKRTYQARTIAPDGTLSKAQSVSQWHPHVHYLPPTTEQRETIGGDKVRWDQPMVHVTVNKPADPASQWGFPDAYPAIPWARMSKEYLEAWFKLMQALARYAWRTSTKGSKVQQAAARAVQAAAAATPPTPAGPGGQVGAHAFMDQGSTLEAIPKTGATIDATSGRPLQELVAAALDVPLAQLIQNSSTGDNGSRAALTALDQPTELVMGARRKVWTGYYRTILGYVLDAAAAAGKLTGGKPVDKGRGTVWDDTVAHDIQVTWPPFDSLDLTSVVDALVKADSTSKMPDSFISDQLLQVFADALDIDGIDDVKAGMRDTNGVWVPPSQSTADAVAAARDRGEA